MSAKTVEIRWPRYDPSRGYKLCEPCWNMHHFDPPYVDKNGTKHPKTALCHKGECGCGCRPEFRGPRKPKYTKAGQIPLPEVDSLFVGPKAAELKAQVETLKR